MRSWGLLKRQKEKINSEVINRDYFAFEVIPIFYERGIMHITSKVTNQTYDDYDTVYIVNPKQAFCYLNNQAKLLDVYCGRDQRLVFVFSKSETAKLKVLWDLHKLS